MRRHASSTRLLALWAMLMMPWAVTGPGVHDPDCPHHRPGASGVSHGGHGAEHGSHHRGGRSDRDCRCLGPCVFGVHAGPLLAASTLFDGAPAAFARSSVVHVVVSLPRRSVAFRLPFATGPPRPA